MTSLQPSTTSSSHRENTDNEHKLWLSDQWYILVDDEGYLKTACFEGALGCVVKVLSNPSPHPDNVSARGQHQPGQQSLALKFPRLLADSERENAYIAGMLEIEASEVGEVHSDPKPGQDSEPPEAACLMPMQRGRSHILRKPRQMQYADPREAAEQDGCILLVSFQKGMRPRFCSVKPLSGNLTVFPRTMETYIRQFITLDRLEARRDKSNNFGRATFCTNPPKDQQTSPATTPSYILAATITGDQVYEYWYAGLPSILYTWATGTLQEAVGRSLHKAWSVHQNYELLERIIRAVDNLHGKKVIHGDIRPANIMALGKPNVVHSYVLSDYGSFSSDDHRSAEVTGESGNTVIGQGIHRHRLSAFYSPERRHGGEKENADIAVVVRKQDKGSQLIRLGWRSQLVDTETGRLKVDLEQPLSTTLDKLLSKKQSDSRTGAFTSETDILRAGDRIRLRDYIFTIEAVDDDSQTLSYLVSNRTGKVMHERIVVYDKQASSLNDGTLISLPSYTEIRAWSAATDIYSIGVLAIYLLYTCAKAQGQAVIKEIQSSLIEDELLEIVKVLENPTCFVYLYPNLVRFKTTIEDNNIIKASGSVGLEKYSLLDDDKREISLFEYGRDTVLRAIEFAPNLDIIFRVMFHRNIARFLLFMHFVFCCIHRRGDAGYDVFCKDRFTAPEKNGAADAAGKRLKILMNEEIKSSYDGFTWKEQGEGEGEDKLNTTVKTNYEARIQLAMLKTAMDKAYYAAIDLEDGFWRFWRWPKLARTLVSLVKVAKKKIVLPSSSPALQISAGDSSKKVKV